MNNPIGGNWVGGPTANRAGFRADIIAWNPGTWLVNGIDAAIFWREALPQARIGLRLMPDDAIQLEWTVGEWLIKWQPMFPLLQQYNIHVITGNEPPGHDVEQLRKIVRFEVEVAEILEGEGLFGMFGRFPVGHPSEKPAVLALLDPLIRAITARPGNTLMLNEYALVTQPLLEQPWHVGRFQNILDMFGDVDIDIGEISINTPTTPGSTEQDSGSGWRKASEFMWGGVYPLGFADGLISMWENIYKPARVVKSINPFLLGGADNQRVQDLLAKEDEWRIFAGAMAGYRDVPAPPPVIEEPDDDDDTKPVNVEPIPIPIEEETPMNKLNIILAIALVAVLLLVGGVVSVLANVPGTGFGELLSQVVPVAEETSGPISTEQGRQFIEDITNTSLIGGAVTGAVVLLIVQILKYIPIAWLQRRTATDMATGVATILLLAGAAFSETSYAGTFDNSVAFMESIAPLILGLLMAVTTSGGIFNGLKRVGAPEASFFGKRAAA